MENNRLERLKASFCVEPNEIEPGARPQMRAERSDAPDAEEENSKEKPISSARTKCKIDNFSTADTLHSDDIRFSMGEHTERSRSRISCLVCGNECIYDVFHLASTSFARRDRRKTFLGRSSMRFLCEKIPFHFPQNEMLTQSGATKKERKLFGCALSARIRRTREAVVLGA